MMHELGHALGLKHGHETSVYGPLPTANDSHEYSIMTYRSYPGSPGSFYTNETYGGPQSYMMADIAALQYMYGADFTTNAGNTVYRWTPGAGTTFVNGVAALDPGGNRIFLTVWDGGGSDTYDLSGYSTSLKIDLAPGAYSTFSSVQQSALGDGNLARGNVYNALQYDGDARSLIENAIGGSGNDTINGNAAANALNGGLGNDSLNGGTGLDIMIGAAGNDTYYVDNFYDTVSETLSGTAGGTDTVYANASFTLGVNVESLYLFGTDSIDASGNAGINDISGTIGNNYLRGFELADTLRAGSGNDTLDGGTGGDAMTGGQGNDTYYVGNAADTTIESISGAEGGTDTVYATVGFTLATNVETLFLVGTTAANGTGNTLSNAISGNSFVNTLRGLAGNDTFQSGNGADVVIGGTGNDTFRFTTTVGSNPSARDILRAGDGAVAFERPGATLGDRIDLALVDANTGSGGTQHFTYGTSTGVGRLWKTESGTLTLINGNTDADSAIEFQIAIEDGSVRSSAYSGADFLLA